MRRTLHLAICDRCGFDQDLGGPSDTMPLPHGWKELVISERDKTAKPKDMCPECVSLIQGTGNNKQRR